MKCVDPVQVMLSLEPMSGQTFTGLFTQSDIVSLGGGTSLNISMGRNATHLDFQVSLCVFVYSGTQASGVGVVYRTRPFSCSAEATGREGLR